MRSLLRRATLALSAVLLAATAVAAQDQDLSALYAKDQLVGRGSFKSVWTVKDARSGEPVPGKVLVVLEKTEGFKEYTTEFLQGMIRDEVAMYERLGAAGVPADRYLATGTFEGSPAGAQEQFLTDNHRWTFRYRGQDMNQERRGASPTVLSKWTILNARSLADLTTIRDRLAASGLLVRDPQVLVAEDGHVVLFDPLEIKTAAELGDPDMVRRWGKRMDSLLDILLREARAAVLATRLQELVDGRGRKLFDEDEARDLATYPRGENGPTGLLDLLSRKLGRGADAQRVREAIAAGTVTLDLTGTGEPGAVPVPVEGSLGAIAETLRTRVLAELERRTRDERPADERAGSREDGAEVPRAVRERGRTGSGPEGPRLGIERLLDRDLGEAREGER